MNPNEIFWLARYAYTTVNPLVAADERLIIHLQFDGRYSGVDIWIHTLADSKVRAYKTILKTKGDVDRFVASIEAKASVLV